MRDAPDRHRAAEFFRDRRLEVLFDAGEFHGWQEFPIRQLRETFRLTADADELLDMVVPGFDIAITDRPVDGDAIAGIGLEIHLAPSIRLTTPHDRAAANVIT